MKALIYSSKGKIEFVEKENPRIINDDDAIIKVTLSSICTSDLHIIEGCVPRAKKGVVLGHEFCGIVVDTGKNVKKIKKGDRVALNCESFCGKCFYCKKGFVNNCSFGGWLLGCTIDGAQAEYVRVPYIDYTSYKIPDNLSFKDVLFVGDILASGFWSAKLCEIDKNDTVALIGAGPVGLCAAQSLRHFKTRKIILIDTNKYRLNLAKKLNLADYTLNPLEVNVEDEILKLTNNKGADKVIEAAGGKNTFELSWKIARANAIVVICAMYEENQILPLPYMYGKNLTFKTGGVDATDCDKLIELISKNQLNTNFLITHEINFKDILKGYEIFKNKKDNCLKIAINYD